MGFWERLEAIPSQYRWAMIPGILVLLGATYWYFMYQPRAEAITRLEEQIVQKRRTLNKHRKIAAQYEEFKARVEELEDQLREALTRLPKRKEIPDLIRKISDLGVRTGLQISLLRPQPETRKEFYADVPITVQVIGKYHAVGQFFGALGQLPRLISITNVQMTRNAKVLQTQCVATTFRYLEEVGSGEADGEKK